MAQRTYRPYDPTGPIVAPGDLRAWLPADHRVFLLSDLVDTLDLSPILSMYEHGDGRGYPPYHPVLLTKLLLYAYCEGETRSRHIMRKTYEDAAYRILAVNQHPDFRTISDFRERHLVALTALFTQVVQLAQRLELVRLAHVAQDGTKGLANASKHKAMSYARMVQAEARLGGEIAALLEQARRVDAAEDAQYGVQGSGDEVPSALAGEVERRERRLATIRAAKAALEAEAAARAAAVRAADEAERAARVREGRPQKKGRRPQPKEQPAATAQRNFTDPDARIMKNSDHAYVEAYNGQAAVDSQEQIIVGCLLTNQATDYEQLPPMVAQVQATTGQHPERWSADAGYCSAENLRTLEGAGIDAYLAPGREETTPVGSRLPEPAGDQTDPAAEAGAKAQMRAKLATAAGKAVYRWRKAIVEPVFGQSKEGRGLRRFRLRGVRKVAAEWTLWCLTHNLVKVIRALQARPALRTRLATA